MDFRLKLILFLTVLLFCVEYACYGKKYCDEVRKNYQKHETFDKMTDIIEIHSGKIKGRILRNVLSGAEYSCFKGIRYAEPPVGKNRFQPPIEVKNWTNVVKTIEHGNICPQMDFHDDSQFHGDEDCLFLNVYTPLVNFGFNHNKTIENPKIAVMVWIHGGAFYFGSGDSHNFGPDFLIDKNVILVTFNYRLGAPGFLNMYHPSIPGNAGLKDQVLVLKWVKKNIAKFGGDVNNITIFGQSAGGACIDMHLISDMSQNLFHRSIALSGSVFCRWAFTADPMKHARKLAKNMKKFRGYDSNQMALQFLTADIQILTSVTAKLVDVARMELPFVPSIEIQNVSWNNAFMDDCYDRKFKNGHFFQGQHMFGHTNAETSVLLRKLDERIRNLIRKHGEYNTTSGNASPVLQTNEATLKLRSGSILENSAKELFENPIDLKRQYMLEYGNIESLYFYIFGYEEEDRLLIPGATHGDDLQYIFYMQGKKQLCEKYSSKRKSHKINRDAMMRERFVTLLTNFAKYGNPSISIEQHKDIFNINWRKLEKNGVYLTITDTGSFEISYKRPIKNKIKLDLCKLVKPSSYDLLTQVFLELL